MKTLVNIARKLFGNRSKEEPMFKSTSIDAHESIKPLKPRIRDQVLKLVKQSGSVGVIDEQLIAALPNYAESSVRTRRSELVEAGLVISSSRTRRTSSGRESIVWVATPNVMQNAA